jgi:hypothetical protein
MYSKKPIQYFAYTIAFVIAIVIAIIFLPFNLIYFIPVIFAVFIFNKLFRKKTFEQLFSELHFKKTSEGIVSVMSYIHSYIQKYTFEELIIFNLKYNGIRYYPYYYYIIPMSLCVILQCICAISMLSLDLFFHIECVESKYLFGFFFLVLSY